MLPRTGRRTVAPGLRRRRVVVAGHRGDAALARTGLSDADPAVQEAAIGALARLGELTTGDVRAALAGGAPVVRRRAAEAATAVRGRGTRSTLPTALVTALGMRTRSWSSAPPGSWANGATVPPCPRSPPRRPPTPTARCREAAVAALGAIGDPVGLPAVLDALGDQPTVRRRAAVALAGFDGPRVDPALRQAAEDRDWQVRQAAEMLLGGSPGAHPPALEISPSTRPGRRGA